MPNTFVLNPFDELLREFQEAYAEFRYFRFCISGMTPDEWREYETRVQTCWRLLEFLPLSDGECPEGYLLYARVRNHRDGQWAERDEEPFECFEALAAAAGAALPRCVRQKIPFEPASAVAGWLAYLWWGNPPSEAALAPPENFATHNRLIFSSPFLDSANAIERGGLNTGGVPAGTSPGSTDSTRLDTQDTAPATDTKPRLDNDEFEPLATALLVRGLNPTQIAERLGVPRQRIYENRITNAVRLRLEELAEPQKAGFPKGEKSEDGTIEAYDRPLTPRRSSDDE